MTKMDLIEMNYNSLLDAGCERGPWLPTLLNEAKNRNITSASNLLKLEKEVRSQNKEWNFIEKMKLRDEFVYFENYLDDDDQDNYDTSMKAMIEVMRSPISVKGALMPDACPTGPKSIPVGGVVASTHLVPSHHSADICCSLMATNVGADVDLKKLMDAAHANTHFGAGGRKVNKIEPNKELMDLIDSNPMTKKLKWLAVRDMGSQGDGNHFLTIGTDLETNEAYIITHHGSRGFGAAFYKNGQKIVKKHMAKVCPEIGTNGGWLPEGKVTEEYWDGLQIIRDWTKQNHAVIHDATVATIGGKVKDRFWNEHNFVFKKPNDNEGLFYHAKGATPAYKNWADDASDLSIIPLNMGAPILFVSHVDNGDEINFAPHGAGRNVSRTKHKKNVFKTGLSDIEILEKETKGLDCRFFSGNIDISELPSAYKDPSVIIKSIETNNLAKIEKQITPFGSIMNGENKYDRYKSRSR